MTTAQVVETSVTVNNNNPIHDQDYVHPDDQTQSTTVYDSTDYLKNESVGRCRNSVGLPACAMRREYFTRLLCFWSD